MAEVIVPAREARTMEVKKGQTLEIVDLEGQQVGDFTAWLASDPNEYLSPSHTVSSLSRQIQRTSYGLSPVGTSATSQSP